MYLTSWQAYCGLIDGLVAQYGSDSLFGTIKQCSGGEVDRVLEYTVFDLPLSDEIRWAIDSPERS